MLSRRRLSGHEESSNIDVCAWSPVECVLITAGTDRKVFLWDLGGGGGDDKGSQTKVVLYRDTGSVNPRLGPICGSVSGLEIHILGISYAKDTFSLY